MGSLEHISFFVSEWSDLSYQLPSRIITQVYPTSCFVYCKCNFGKRHRVQSQQQTEAYSGVIWEVWMWGLQGTQWDIPSSMSLENLLRILPVGVVSKNFIGLRRIRRKSSSWSLEDALRVPWQCRKDGRITKQCLPSCHCFFSGTKIFYSVSLSSHKRFFYCILCFQPMEAAINLGRNLAETVQPQELAMETIKSMSDSGSNVSPGRWPKEPQW